ncbi:MAG: HDOD domain-containing protein [Gemmatimonadota bacterium]|nr:HDOD domain-containing protein [Gemmatimonadota bacterium]
MSFRKEILDSIQQIPPMPMVAIRLANLLNDPSVDIGVLVETVKYDPGLTAQLIRMANSAYFSSATEVTSLKDTLVRLGNNQLFSFVIATTVRPILDTPLKGYSLETGELWQHSVAVAVCAEKFEMDLLKGTNGEIAFTTGLLHDMGKLVMSTFVEDLTEKIKSFSFGKQLSFEKAEMEIFDIDHTEVGAVLLENWGFPEEIVSVVRWHHDPNHASENQYLTDLVHIADSVCMSLGVGVGIDGLCYNLCSESCERLGLDILKLELLASSTIEKMELVNQMFSGAV